MKTLPISEAQQKQLSKTWKMNNPWIGWFVEMLVLEKQKWQFALLLRPWTMVSKWQFLFPPRFLPFSTTIRFQNDCMTFPFKSIISTAFDRPKTERKFWLVYKTVRLILLSELTNWLTRVPALKISDCSSWMKSKNSVWV